MRPLALHLRPARIPPALLVLALLVLALLASGCAVGRAGAAVEALERDPVVLPDDYGDDPVLDRMWDDCAGGFEGACEELKWSSPVSSSYNGSARRAEPARPG